MTIAEKVRQQFVMGIRWANGQEQPPVIIAVCKKCGNLFIDYSTYNTERNVTNHMSQPCWGELVSGDLPTELNKILTALEKAE